MEKEHASVTGLPPRPRDTSAQQTLESEREKKANIICCRVSENGWAEKKPRTVAFRFGADTARQMKMSHLLNDLSGS